MSEDLRAYAQLLGLSVHDLRNPLATLSATIEYVHATGVDPAIDAALADASIAARELARGLDQLGWLAQWTVGERPLAPCRGDVRDALATALAAVGAPPIAAEVPSEALVIERAGPPLARLIELLLRNAVAFAPRASVRVRARAVDVGAVIEIRDAGLPLAPELRESAFTLAGQGSLKGRRDGRYSRVVGLHVARRLADDLGATLDATSDGGEAVFVLRLPRA